MRRRTCASTTPRAVSTRSSPSGSPNRTAGPLTPGHVEQREIARRVAPDDGRRAPAPAAARGVAARARRVAARAHRVAARARRVAARAHRVAARPPRARAAASLRRPRVAARALAATLDLDAHRPLQHVRHGQHPTRRDDDCPSRAPASPLPSTRAP